MTVTVTTTRCEIAFLIGMLLWFAVALAITMRYCELKDNYHKLAEKKNVTFTLPPAHTNQPPKHR